MGATMLVGVINNCHLSNGQRGHQQNTSTNKPEKITFDQGRNAGYHTIIFNSPLVKITNLITIE